MSWKAPLGYLILELVTEGTRNESVPRGVRSTCLFEKKKMSVTIPSSHGKSWCSALIMFSK